MEETKKFEEMSLSEQADLEYQVNDQIRTFRMAWNMGDINTVSRAGLMWFNLLASNMSDKEKETFNSATLPIEAIKEYREFYTAEDIGDIEAYGELEDDRISELVRESSIKNKARFYESWSRKAVILFNIMNRLGIGFTKETKEDI